MADFFYFKPFGFGDRASLRAVVSGAGF